jgi:L-asparaginase / beta-aspartyl-peptidase
MEGGDLRVGAVAGILGPRNPILAARAVMEHAVCVLLVGEARSPLPAARHRLR